jgi:DNA-binding XRE family transcriptional regulator
MDDTPGRVIGDDINDVTAQAIENTSRDNPDESGDVEERTREIRQEIEETRDELAETIGAIQEKLTPRNIVASATDRVKNVATERVREMADTASQTAHQAMNYARDATSGMTERVRQNPLPLALLGIGAAWLLARSQRQSSGRSYGMRRDQRDYGREYGVDRTRDDALYGDYGDHGVIARIQNNPIPAALAGVGLSWLAFSSSSRDREYVAQSDGASRENVSSGWSEGKAGEGIAQTVTDSANHVASRTREYASDASDSMRRMMRQRQHQIQRMVQDNPLLVGAGALMLGAAFGMAVPESETENALMGEARDTMIERGREMARDTVSQVQDAAGSVAEAAEKIVDKKQQ